MWVLVFFLLAASAFALFQVPYIAMPAEITDSVEERTTMMSWRVAFLAFGILLFGVGAPALPDAANGGSAGYLAMAVGVALVIALGMLGCWWILRRTRPVPIDAVEAPSHSLRQQFAIAWRTRAFAPELRIQARKTCAMLGAAEYFATYVMDQESLSDVLFAALIVPALVVMPLWAWVGHRHGKRVGYLASSLVFMGGALTLLMASLVPSGAVLGMVALCGIGYAGMQMFPLAMLPDTIAADSSLHRASSGPARPACARLGRPSASPSARPWSSSMLAVTGFVSSSDCTAVQPASAEVGVLLAFSVSGQRRLTVVPAPHPPVRARTGRSSRRHAMSIPSEGREPAVVLSELESLRRKDAPVHGGRVLAYVYDAGVPGLAEAGRQALASVGEVNALDPRLPERCPARERPGGLGTRPAGRGRGAAGGVVTSGGTELCIVAVLAARQDCGRRGGTGQPVLIVSITAHPAFAKAAHLLGLALRCCPRRPGVDARAVPLDVEAALDEIGDAAALVVRSPLGMPTVSSTRWPTWPPSAAARGVACHWDACIGGLVLPYLRLGGASRPRIRPLGPRCAVGVRGPAELRLRDTRGTPLLLFSDTAYRLGSFFTYSTWPGYPVVNTTPDSTKSACCNGGCLAGVPGARRCRLR